jgi:hypothetical protein
MKKEEEPERGPAVAAAMVDYRRRSLTVWSGDGDNDGVVVYGWMDGLYGWGWVEVDEFVGE